MATDAALTAALEPVREAMLVAAREDAATLEAQAVEAARRGLADARAEAVRVRAEARAQGAADAAAVLAGLRARAGRQARAVVLGARREEYEALRAAARDAVTALPDDPDYPGLRARLADAVRARLGPDAQVLDAPGGGVTGSAPGRRLDYSLAGYADRAVDAVAAELDEP